MYKNENDTLVQVISGQSIDIGRYEVIMSRLHEEYPKVEDEVLKNLE
jgi:hypothetical protein